MEGEDGDRGEKGLDWWDKRRGEQGKEQPTEDPR